MARFKFQTGTFTDGLGRIVVGGTVTVYLSGTTNLATVYAAETGSAITGSTITTDSAGMFEFWVDDGDYADTQRFKLTLVNTGFITQTFDDVIIFIELATDPTITDFTNATHTHANAANGGNTLTIPTIGDFSNATHTHANNANGGNTLSVPTIADFSNATHTHANAANGGNTLTIPTIGDFSNAIHDHADAAGGGGIMTRSNALINADFNIWQRGASLAAIADGTISADRFKYNKNGTMVHTVSRSTNVPTVAESNHLSKYSIKVDCTTVDSSISPGNYCFIEQKVEGFNFLPLAQQAMTLSFWHKHTKTGTYCVAVRNSGADRSYVAEYTQTTTDTWEKATITITASPGGGTWNYDTGVGLFVDWSLAMGSDFHGTADTWNSANDIATSNQVNATDSTDNDFRLVQVKLEQGSVATRFVGEEIGADLHRCKRYYEVLNNGGNTAYRYNTGQCVTTTAAHIPLLWEVEKRTTPAVTISAAGDFKVFTANATGQAVTGFSLTNEAVLSAVGIITVAANLIAGNATTLKDDDNGNSRIYIDAEL